MYLTPRGIAVLVAAPLLYLAGELFGFAFARALGAVALAVVIVGVPRVLRRPHVEVRRDVYPDRVERDQPAMARLEVRNLGGRRHPAFTAKDVVDDMYREVLVRGLGARAAATYRYQLRTGRRGRFPVGPLVLERGDPLGLVRSVLVTGSVGHLWVYPRRYPVRTAGLGWPRYHHDGERTVRPPAGSSDLRRIREYVPGDDTRLVHWKAVARTGTLMVREYADPAEPRLTVVLDNRVGALEPVAFEEAVEVAASFACAALDAGYRTGVLTTAGDLHVDTTAGRAGIRDVLDRLTELGQRPGSAAPPPVESGALIMIGGAIIGDESGRAPRRGPVTVFDLRGPAAGEPRSGASAAAGPSGTVGPTAVIAADTAAEAIRRWNLAGGP